MKHIRLAAWLLLAVCLSACSKRREDDSRTLVVQVPNTEKRELTPAGLVRKVYDFEGHLVEHHYPYQDGGYAHVIYRADGTVAETLEEYPIQPGASAPIRKSEATFAPDGKTVLLGKAYRLDGSLRMVRRASADGRWLDEDYLPGGRLAFKSERNPDGSWLITCFRGDGTRDSIVHVERVKGSPDSEAAVFGEEPEPRVRSIEGFDQTGQTRIWRQIFAQEGENLDSFQPLFNAPDASKKTTEAGRLVYFYGDDQKVSHRQWWSEGRTDNAEDEEYTLEAVEQYKDTQVIRKFLVEDLGDEVSVTKLEQQAQPSEFPKVSGWTADPDAGLPIESWVQGKTRVLLVDEFCELADSLGKRLGTVSLPEKETIDTRLFKRPSVSLYPALNEELAQDDAQWMAEQDPNNPCHWYHNL